MFHRGADRQHGTGRKQGESCFFPNSGVTGKEQAGNREAGKTTCGALCPRAEEETSKEKLPLQGFIEGRVGRRPV
jgi:hypothetical protein